MALTDLSDWLDEHSGPSFVWYVKRLAGNDTAATGGHQGGPYIAKEFLFRIFPAISRTDTKNPDVWFDLYVDSHADHRKVRAVYYNNKFHGKSSGGRNETRLTNFGGQTSALLDPESTGALTVFAFRLDDAGLAIDAHVWVCSHDTEADLVEDRLGPVDPGRYIVWPADSSQPSLFTPANASCWMTAVELPGEWLGGFPTASEIVRYSVMRRLLPQLTPDQRLLKRRECEFEIFQSVEQAVELPNILAGFATVDDFILRAQTILQRRKSRSGRSLELQTREIFLEENLVEGINFTHQPQSEAGKRPDFLFPSQAAYAESAFPAERLRMLAVKTTCRDRWRQILTEAGRIPIKHLLTLQEGVSESQFREMSAEKVRLVVPAKLTSKFPASVQPHLMTLESFIGDVRLLTL